MKIAEEDIRYVDRPEVVETFIDHLQSMFFDGVTFRMELSVTRTDKPQPPNPLTAKRYPICRLTMPPETMLEIFNQLQGFVNALTQQGIIKRTTIPTTTKQ